MIQSSPYAWGCFYLLLGKMPGNAVFPMHMGVFVRDEAECFAK
jgi:hypothetical protein